jgi:hypothetical protein
MATRVGCYLNASLCRFFLSSRPLQDAAGKEEKKNE